MIDPIETGIARLRAAPLDRNLDRLEASVWARVEGERAEVFGGRVLPVQIVVTCAALLIGLAMAEIVDTGAPAFLSETAVLSDDGALAPSVRLGGGA